MLCETLLTLSFARSSPPLYNLSGSLLTPTGPPCRCFPSFLTFVSLFPGFFTQVAPPVIVFETFTNFRPWRSRQFNRDLHSPFSLFLRFIFNGLFFSFSVPIPLILSLCCARVSSFRPPSCLFFFPPSFSAPLFSSELLTISPVSGLTGSRLLFVRFSRLVSE